MQPVRSDRSLLRARRSSAADLRLLLVSDHYPPFIGGAHRQTELLAHELAARGHEVHVATQWHSGMARREVVRGVVVHRVRQLRTVVQAFVRDTKERQSPPFPDPVSIWDLSAVLREARPHVVHSYGWLTFSIAAALVGTRVPLIVSARDYGYFCATRTFLHEGRRVCSGPAPGKCLACARTYYGAPKGWIAAAGVAACRPLLRRKLSVVHSVSRYMQHISAQHMSGARDAPIQVMIPSFQARAPDEPARGDAAVEDVLAQLPAQPFILFVGPLRRIKGVELLFDAYARLRAPAPPLVLIGLIGHDPPRRIPADATVIVDAPHEAVLAAWDRALFGVMPSLWPEPLGAVVAEAMSCGRAVIGTRLGGHGEMLDESCGMLVPPGDVAALAAAMQALVDDPERRNALGAAARVRARDFTADTIVPRFEQAYRDVLAVAARK
jgi:glycosyltransferase involved in cell wall biosynthesis